MPRTLKEIMIDLHDMMNNIVKEENEVDYVAVLDFADDVPAVDIVRASSKYRNLKRPVDDANIIETIALERKLFRVNPYDEDQIRNGRDHLYRFSPTSVDQLVLMFACYNHGDIDTFRAECHRKRKPLIEKLKELEAAS